MQRRDCFHRRSDATDHAAFSRAQYACESAMEQHVSFPSDSVVLSGTLHRPDQAEGELRAGMILAHGFGGSSNGAGHPELAQALKQAGYVSLRFDFRGCGASGGEAGRRDYEEEVQDLLAAVTFLQAQPGVDPERIGVFGASMGGSVAICATARAQRLKACIANGSVGNGERRFRSQY